MVSHPIQRESKDSLQLASRLLAHGKALASSSRRPPSPLGCPPSLFCDCRTFGLWHRRHVAYVYILRCADDSLYIGETDDVEARLQRHNDGKGCRFTARRRPVFLVYSEQYESRQSARARERQLKRWTRKKKEALIRGDVQTVHCLAIRRVFEKKRRV